MLGVFVCIVCNSDRILVRCCWFFLVFIPMGGCSFLRGRRKLTFCFASVCFSGSGSLISSVGFSWSRLNRSGWTGGSVAGVSELATIPAAALIVSSPKPSNGLVSPDFVPAIGGFATSVMVYIYSKSCFCFYSNLNCLI